jgi:N-acetylmuramoyl-L-alanine amidase
MDDRELFARIIKCEAGGEGEEGMKAVATVVMNRVRVPYGEYRRVCRGSLHEVIVQMCQFSCYKSTISGVANPQNVWVLSPERVHYQIADWAISGGIYAGVGDKCLWYMNPFSPQCPNFFPYNGTGYWFTRVNQHCFFSPTDKYADT